MIDISHIPFEGRTYLDDVDHVWAMDPAAAGADLEAVMRELFEMIEPFDISRHVLDAPSIDLIMRGAAGLLNRHAGTPGECLKTSLIWFFG